MSTRRSILWLIFVLVVAACAGPTLSDPSVPGATPDADEAAAACQAGGPGSTHVRLDCGSTACEASCEDGSYACGWCEDRGRAQCECRPDAPATGGDS